LLYEEGRFAESLEKVTKTLDLYGQNLGTHYDNYPTALIIRGLSLTKTGQSSEGEAILLEASRSAPIHCQKNISGSSGERRVGRMPDDSTAV